MSVLVVGAGPTGLTLALDLVRRGVAVRVIDKASGPFQGSRAKGLKERSLEILAGLGVSAAIEAAGWDIPARVYVNGRLEREARMAGAALIIPQWSIEKALRDKLAEYGVKVEYDTPLESFVSNDDGVIANGTIEAEYLAGCDGGHSTVRKQLGIPFEGETEDHQLLILADATLTGLAADATYLWVDPSLGMFAASPFKATTQWQLVVGVPNAGEPTPELFEEYFRRFTDLPEVTIIDYTWMSAYRVNVRMVRRYRVGRVFLAGDAAHVHPPAGGLGMNTGIQDADNLGWKLAAGTEDLLDSYEKERLPVAEWALTASSEALTRLKTAVVAGDSDITATVRT